MDSLTFLQEEEEEEEEEEEDLVLKGKKITCHLLNFDVPADHSGSKRDWKAIKIAGLCQRAEKAVENESEGDMNCFWSSWNSFQRLGKEIEGNKDQSKNRDQQDHNTVEIN